MPAHLYVPDQCHPTIGQFTTPACNCSTLFPVLLARSTPTPDFRLVLFLHQTRESTSRKSGVGVDGASNSGKVLVALSSAIWTPIVVVPARLVLPTALVPSGRLATLSTSCNAQTLTGTPEVFDGLPAPSLSFVPGSSCPLPFAPATPPSTLSTFAKCYTGPCTAGPQTSSKANPYVVLRDARPRFDALVALEPLRIFWGGEGATIAPWGGQKQRRCTSQHNVQKGKWREKGRGGITIGMRARDTDKNHA